MLLKQTTLAGIADGTITTVYRRWKTARVNAGSKLRTPIGIVEVTRIEPASLSAITDRDARKAGYASRRELLTELKRHTEGRLYRIGVRLGGADPRQALRANARFQPGEVEELADRLAKLGARTVEGPWALAVLRLIAANPEVRAADLAAELGMETRPFKTRVRRLKELGLTESLEVGYRLSPRGKALLRKLPRP